MVKLLVLVLVYVVVGVVVEIAEELWCVYFSKQMFGTTKPIEGPIESRKGVYDAEYFVLDLKHVLMWPYGLLCIGVALLAEQMKPGSITEKLKERMPEYYD